MSSSSTINSPEEDNDNIRWKMIGCREAEEELHKQIMPMMYECYQLGIINHDTVSSLLRFCLQFWMGHFRMKQQQFEMSQQEIEQEEKKKLAAIIAEKQAWEKNGTIPPRE